MSLKLCSSESNLNLQMDESTYESDSGESLDLFEADGEEEELEFSEIFSLGSNDCFQLHATAVEQRQNVQSSTIKSSETPKVPAEISVSNAADPPTNKSCDSISPLKPTDAHPSSSFSPSPPMSRIGLNAHKAGMEGLDKTKINQIILEASKGSKFYDNEVKKEKQVTRRINHMLQELKKITPAQKLSALKAADKELELLEVSRDLRHIIVHIDMDAFYAAVEMRDNPKLKDVPMAVGSNYMLSTSNYVARRYGVRAAMPGFIAKKLCPELVIVKLNFAKYQQVCKEVREILADYDPDFCPMGLDESYLDLTDYVASKLQEGVHVVREMSEGCLKEGYEHCSVVRSTDGGMEVRSVHVSSCREIIHDYSHKEPMKEPSKSSCSTVPKPGAQLAVNYTTDAHLAFSSSKDHSSNPNLTSTLTSDNHKASKHMKNQSVPGRFKVDPETDDSDLCVGEPNSQPGGSLPSSHWEYAKDVVEEIRARIFEKTGLTASAGIAPNKLLAKVASDMNKPNGQHSVTPTREAVLGFVQNLSIRKISGIGKVTERMLNSLGVSTCRDLYKQRAVLLLLFSRISSHFFLQICLGIGSSDTHRVYERKSISTERTFSELSDPEDLHRKCQELCQSLAEDMQKERVWGCTVTLKLKTVNFEVKSRAVTLPKPICSPEELCTAASELLKTEIKAYGPSLLRLRLMGVRISSLQNNRGRCRQDTLEGFFQQPSQLSDHRESTHTKLDTRDVASKGSTATCPVCRCQVAADNMTMNRHIDECLNQSAIQEVMGRAMWTAQSSTPVATSDLPSNLAKKKLAHQEPPTKKRRQCLNQSEVVSGTTCTGWSLGSSRLPTTPTSDLNSQPSKRKSAHKQPPTKKKTLDYFWK